MRRPPTGVARIHRWIWIALTACGPSMQGSPPPAPRGGEAFTLADAEPATASRGAAGPAKASRGAAGGDAALWLDAHNRLRARHCAGELVWSAKLAQVAQHWANALRDRDCAFDHSNGSYGENLAAGTSGTLGPRSVVEMWYDEVAQYRFPDGGFSMKTGHFTQLVWRGTKQVGCGRSQCKGMDVFVCEYDPPGNWEGKYRENVRPRGCQ
jgi:uncharacterized protein YkwD